MDINNTDNNNTENKETPETTAQPQTSYAVRPEHRRHRRLEYAVIMKIAEVSIRLFKK